MFLFHPTHFLKFLVKSQPQRSFKKGSYIKIECIYGVRSGRRPGVQNIRIVADRSHFCTQISDP